MTLDMRCDWTMILQPDQQSDSQTCEANYSVAPRRRLGIFARHPVPGRCKTRLAAAIGEQAAANLAAAFVRDVAERFHDVGDARALAYTPATDEALSFFERLDMQPYEMWPQPDGDLGARLSAFFDESLRQSERVVVIGADSPTMPKEYVESAFELLRKRDCVLVPATDGGCCLIGLRRWRQALLDDIDWSTSEVLGQLVRRLQESAFTLGLLPPWYDVDSGDDLALLRGHLAAQQVAGEEMSAPATEGVLREMQG